MLPGAAYERNPYWEEREGFESPLRWNAVEPVPHYRADQDGEFVCPNLLSYSDFDNSGPIERANYEAFVERFADLQDVEWWTREGGHDSHGIVIRRDADARVPELGEVVKELEYDPIIDEAAVSRVEMETYAEAWTAYGADEFLRWLEEQEGETVKDTPWADAGVLVWRVTIAQAAPKLDPLVDELSDAAVVRLMTALGWGTEASEEARTDAWAEAVRSSFEEEIRDGMVVNYRFDAGFRAFLRYGVDQGKLRVALDVLLENGGEWTEAAAQVLR